MATIDLTSGNPTGIPGPGQAPISLGSLAPTRVESGNPYDIFVSNLMGMLSHSQQINATNNQALLGQKDALETQSVAGPNGPQTADPGVWSGTQDAIQKGWAAAYAPAVTSLTDQVNANTNNMNAINDTAGTMKDAFRPMEVAPGSSVVTPGGTVVLNGTTYSVNPDPTNPGHFVATPQNSLGGASGSGGANSKIVHTTKGDVDLSTYATDPHHAASVSNIYSTLSGAYPQPTSDTLTTYIQGHASSKSPVTGQMIMNAAAQYGVDPNFLAALLAQESDFGTTGAAVNTLNPGNVGNTDSGSTRAYKSWQAGVNAAANEIALRTHAAGDASSGNTSGFDLSTMAKTYAQAVAGPNPTSGYQNAINAMGIFKDLAQPALDAEIRKINPTFNSAQAKALETQQGTIGPAIQYANSALDKLADAVKGGSVPGQGSNQPQFNALGNLISSVGNINPEHTAALSGFTAEARRAITVALAAKSGGTPTGYEGSAMMILPDNPTPAQISGAKKVLANLGDAAKDIYGNPGGSNGGALPRGNMSARDYVEKVLSSQGMKYSEVLSKLPPGHVGAIDNATGALLQMLPSDFDPKKHTHI